MNKYLSCIALILYLLMSTTSGSAETTLINVYDANGNLVSGDGQYYEYNDANQLVRVRQGDQNGTAVAEYFYDSTGQRVKKIENGVVTYYVGKHFEKQVGGSNPGNNSYYFAEDGERLAKKDPSGNIYYYHLDHLDGINVVTNAIGAEIARSDYLPFGDTRSDSSGAEKYGYSGKEKDKTELYYFEARYNSPANRHFTQADAAEPDYDDPQDLNRYAYVGNNPLSYVDYDGFKKKKKHHTKKEEKILAKQRAAANALKKSAKKEKEKQRAAADYAKHHPASSLQRGVGYSLTSGRAVEGMVLGASTQKDEVLQNIFSLGKLATKAVRFKEGINQKSYGGNALSVAYAAIDFVDLHQTNKAYVASGQGSQAFSKELEIVSGLFDVLFSIGVGGEANDISGGVVKQKSMGIIEKHIINYRQDKCSSAELDDDCLD